MNCLFTGTFQTKLFLITYSSLAKNNLSQAKAYHTHTLPWNAFYKSYLCVKIKYNILKHFN